MAGKVGKMQRFGRSILQCVALAAFCVADGHILPAGAQTNQVKKTPNQSHDRGHDEIVVEAYPNLGNQPTVVHTSPTLSAVNSRKEFELSELLAKCAVRSKLSSTAWLRAAVDGDVNSSAQSHAQDRLKRIYIGCGEGPGLLDMNNPQPPSQRQSQMQRGSRTDLTGDTQGGTDASPLGRSVYDRGALTIQALKTFVPDVSLTAAQTGDPLVQSRFDRREVPRNKNRLPVDKLYFEVAVCIVRLQPALSVRLVMDYSGKTGGRLQNALLNNARICVGESKRVYVDPTQFRLYIADAVYRWTVAARGVDSLIPH